MDILIQDVRVWLTLFIISIVVAEFFKHLPNMLPLLPKDENKRIICLIEIIIILVGVVYCLDLLYVESYGIRSMPVDYQGEHPVSSFWMFVILFLFGIASMFLIGLAGVVIDHWSPNNTGDTDSEDN